jgi:hypothetical protein
MKIYVIPYVRQKISYLKTDKSQKVARKQIRKSRKTGKEKGEEIEGEGDRGTRRNLAGKYNQ